FLELGAGAAGPADPGAPRRPADVEHVMLERQRRLERRIERALSAPGLAWSWRRVAFRYLHRWAERSAPYRENLRFHALRALEKVRDVFVEVGRRLEARRALERADDAFFLDASEALATLGRGPSLPAAEVAALAR